MAIQKLSTVDAFIVLDLDGVPASTGIVRRAPTILPSGAAELARSLTYSYASLGMLRGGASAGVNAPDDRASAALATFAAELAPLVAAGTFLPDPGKGVTDADLAPLRAGDPRNPVDTELHDRLVAAGAVAAAEHALGGLDGRAVAIEGFGEQSGPLVAQLLERGAKVVAVSTPRGAVTAAAGIPALDLAQGAALVGDSAAPAREVFGAACDVLFTGSKLGALDHHGAAAVQASAVIPTAPIPITAKALAALRRAHITVHADFVVLAGPLLAAWGPAGRTPDEHQADAAAAVRGILDEVATHDDGPLLGACYRAESFLRTWRDGLPFGRPLAA